jgi:hypothetical protein
LHADRPEDLRVKQQNQLRHDPGACGLFCGSACASTAGQQEIFSERCRATSNAESLQCSESLAGNAISSE